MTVATHPRPASPMPFPSRRMQEQRPCILSRSSVLPRTPRPRSRRPSSQPNSSVATVSPTRFALADPRGDIGEPSPILKSP
jgi:hypothetical protein